MKVIKIFFGIICTYTLLSGHSLAASHTVCDGFPKSLDLYGSGGMIYFPGNTSSLPREILSPIVFNNNNLIKFCTADKVTPTPVTASATVEVTSVMSEFTNSSGNRIFKLEGNDDFGFIFQFSDSASSGFANKSYLSNNQPYTFIPPKTLQSVGSAATINLVMLKRPTTSVSTFFKQKIGVIKVTSTSLLAPINTLVTPIDITLDPSVITLQAGTCQFTQKTMNITLPTVQLSEFTGINSEVGSNSIPLTMTCNLGITPWATMSDSTNLANTSSELGLTSNSTASGVKIKLYKNGELTPVRFGTQSRISGNPNQWQFGEEADTEGAQRSIQLKANYVQTEQTIVPGKVEAKSTITLSYQ